MATQDYVNGVTLTDAAEFERFDCAGYSVLASVAGTNTITATGPATYTYDATRPPVWFLPAATNTGATTINITPSGGAALGAKNVFYNSAACIGGELISGVPAAVIYDGIRFNIVTPIYISRQTEDTTPDLDADFVMTFDTSAAGQKKVLLGRFGAGVLTAEQLTTSGTSKDFTGIPSWVQQISISFVGVSLSGTSNVLIQIGDSGGVETTAYIASSIQIANAAAVAGTDYTTGFGVRFGGAGDAIHGTVILTREGPSQWTAFGVVNANGATASAVVSGVKALSAALDRVRITTVNGSDTFDAGAVSILYR